MNRTIDAETPRTTTGTAPEGRVNSSVLYHRRSDCRLCHGTDLQPFLSLGPVPPANEFLRAAGEAEMRFPLDVYFCHTCGLVQLLDVVDRAFLFRHYLYVTGTSETMAQHNRAYAAKVVEELRMTPADLVVEVASNDGSLLKEFRRAGVRTLGIEPAENIAAMAREAGIETVGRFFEPRLAEAVLHRQGPARAVVANNVLAHVDDPREFLVGCRRLLAPGGRVIVEVPSLAEMIGRMEYDTIYHEHLSFFSVSALVQLFERAGLRVVRVDHLPVHGGSLRLTAGRDDEVRGHAATVMAEVAREAAAGLTTYSLFEDFAVAVGRNRDALRGLLSRLRARGHTIAAYGAPAKGNTLLTYCGIGPDTLAFTVDRNPLKVGTLTPGMHIPVLAVEALLERRPDFTLILAWNFADEIIAQQQEYVSRGGRFILPIPEPRVLT